MLVAPLGLWSTVRMAVAQGQPGVRRIGLLVPLSTEHRIFAATYASMQEALRKSGWDEGRNLIVEKRYSEGGPERLYELALELLRSEVELIAAMANQAIAAALRATRQTPIVMFQGTLPVESGFVRSLAQPGGNVTGTSASPAEVAGKLVDVVHELIPSARRVAVIWNPDFPGMRVYAAQADRAAAALGITLQYFAATRPEQVPEALAQLRVAQFDALYVVSDPVIASHNAELARFAVERRLPSVGVTPSWTAAGGLLSYAMDYSRMAARTAAFVDRILRGARPADLPVEQPTNYDLCINVQTAKAIGLTIPPSLLLRADRLIE